MAIVSRAPGQVNIEGQRRSSADSGFAGTLATEFELRTGNVDHFRLALRGRIDYQTSVTSTFVVGQGNLGLVGKNRFSNAGLLHVRSGWRWRPRVVPEAYAQLNYDEPQSLEFRSVVGGGIRVGLSDTEATRLWIGTGYMFEHERLDLSDTAVHPRQTSVHRWSSYVTARVRAGPNATLSATGYVQPKIDAFADVRIISDMSVAVSLTTALSFTVNFSLRYDGRPPDDVASLDTALRNGISLSF